MTAVRQQLQEQAIVSPEEFRNGIPYVLSNEDRGTKVFRNDDGTPLTTRRLKMLIGYIEKIKML